MIKRRGFFFILTFQLVSVYLKMQHATFLLSWVIEDLRYIFPLKGGLLDKNKEDPLVSYRGSSLYFPIEGRVVRQKTASKEA